MALSTTSKDGSGSLNPMPFQDSTNALFFDRLRYHQMTGRFCDVTIAINSTSFRAHRLVLASISPFFDSLLKYNRIVKEKVCLRYSNVAAFEALLNYAYSGQITIDRANVIDLLKYSNELMIIRLKSYCVDYLQRYLDASNCVAVKTLAEKYEIPKLVAKSTHYFEQNLNTVLQENPDVLDYEEQEMFELISKYEESIKPDTYFSLVVRWISHKKEQRERFFDNLFKLFPVRELDIGKVECMLDFNPLFRQSERCLFIVLNELRLNGLINTKYDQRHAELHEKFGNLQHDFNENDDDATNMSDESTSVSDLENAGTVESIDDPTEGAAERPSLKLKLSIKPSDTIRRIAKEKRKRGRPRRYDRQEYDPEVDDKETEDQFYNFDENNDQIDFDEPDDLNPEEISLEDDTDALDDADTDQVEQRCEHCPFQTRSTARMKRHFVNAHSKNILYVCNLCNFECKWNRLFYDHMREHFAGPPFHCDSNGCSYIVDRLHVLLSHRLTHTDEKPYKCRECSFRTRNRSNLIVHARIHSGDKPYLCDKCDKRFAIKATLNQHMAAHSEIRPFTCEQCDFATKYQSHLISHRRIHTGDLFRCQEPGCDYSSPKKSQLAAHLRTHLAVRPHHCKTCNRSFIERSHLIRHERIHLKDKPFKCESCDYASSRRDKLKEHVLKHHQNAKTRVKQYRQKNRDRHLAVAKAQQIPPVTNENRFRPIRAEDFENQQQRGHTASADIMPGNRRFEFSDEPPLNYGISATGIARRTSVPPSMDQGMMPQLQHLQHQPMHVTQTQNSSQHQIQQQPQSQVQHHQMQASSSNQHTLTGAGGMVMGNLATFNMSSTINRPRSETGLRNIGNLSPILNSSSMSVDFNNPSDEILGSFLMDNRVGDPSAISTQMSNNNQPLEQIPNNQMEQIPQNNQMEVGSVGGNQQYPNMAIRNPMSVGNIYGGPMDAPMLSFGAGGPVSSHYSMDDNSATVQQSAIGGDIQRPASVPNQYGSQEHPYRTQEQFPAFQHQQQLQQQQIQQHQPQSGQQNNQQQQNYQQW